MIRLPKYGRNIRRYADAAFDSAWRQTMSLSVDELRKYHDASNPDCAVSFDMQLKFGESGLVGATVIRSAPEVGYRIVASHIYPFWEQEYQRCTWHSEIYRIVASRHVIERYGPTSGKRLLYQLPDGEVTAMAVSNTNVGDDFVQHVGEYCRSMIARWELEHRARESNHARMARMGAMMEAAQ